MAKLIVLGANGKAGRRIVEEALGRGHSVTGVVRDPTRSSLEPADSLTIVAGDATASPASRVVTTCW